MKRMLVFACWAVALAGCQDRAAPLLEECRRHFDAGNMDDAFVACKKAVETDANSKAGREAKEVLGAIAENTYQQCEKLFAEGDVEAAHQKCRETVIVFEDSEAAEKSRKKLTEIEPELQKLNKEREQAQAKASAAAREAELKEARKVVVRKKVSDGRDTSCLDKTGLPYLRYYEEGTTRQNTLVAEADGCKSWGSARGPTWFCCPTAR